MNAERPAIKASRLTPEELHMVTQHRMLSDIRKMMSSYGSELPEIPPLPFTVILDAVHPPELQGLSHLFESKA